jgi:hypothetical protein
MNLYRKWLALPEETKYRAFEILLVIGAASIVFAGQMF